LDYFQSTIGRSQNSAGGTARAIPLIAIGRREFPGGGGAQCTFGFKTDEHLPHAVPHHQL
jgi:hypothetical protein